MKILIVFLCIFKLILMVEISFEKLKIEYHNPKYLSFYAGTLRRAGRKSPYKFNIYQELVTGLGNNLTMKWTIFEIISGRLVLTPVQFEYRLCDFLHNDPYLGKMFADQLPKNWKCPFPAGFNNWTDISLHFEYMPYIPFTYSSLLVRVCAVVQGYVDEERAFETKAYALIKQSLADVNSKKKPGGV